MWLNLFYFLNGIYIINFKQLHYEWYDPLFLIFSSFYHYLWVNCKMCHKSFINGYLLAFIINCDCLLHKEF